MFISKTYSQKVYSKYFYSFYDATTATHSVCVIYQLQIAVDEANRRNLAGLFLPQVDPINPCLVLGVTRDNLLQDTLGQLAKHKDMDLKKPLRVGDLMHFTACIQITGHLLHGVVVAIFTPDCSVV